MRGIEVLISFYDIVSGVRSLIKDEEWEFDEQPMIGDEIECYDDRYVVTTRFWNMAGSLCIEVEKRQESS